MKNIDDIIDMLQQQQPAISNPDELTDRIMDALPDELTDRIVDALPDSGRPTAKPARRIRLYITAAMAVAASILLLIVLNTRQPMTDDGMQTTAQGDTHPTPQVSQASQPMPQPSHPSPLTSEPPAHSRVLPAEKVAQRITDIKLVEQHAAVTTADSLDYYISRLEAQLADIRDSCYEARVEHLMRVDDRLQRLVNQLVLEGIIADTLYNTAQTE